MTVAVEQERAVLVTRRHGGLGDILMTRPLFHEIKRLRPGAEVTYALPRIYHQAVSDVSDIDHLVDHEKVRPSEWPWACDISSACLRHEVGYRNRVFLHRSEVWASHLGLPSVDVSTTFRFSEEELALARRRMDAASRGTEVLLVTPFSADRIKDLPWDLLEETVSWCRERNLVPVVLHDRPASLPDGMSLITGVTIREWMACFTMAKMVLSADTAGVHMAGLLRVPACGVFSFTSAEVMTRHYPTVASVQLAAGTEGGLDCCPCYDPGSCPYLTEEKTTPCVTGITREMIRRGLDEAAALPEVERRWSVSRSDPISFCMNGVEPSHKNLPSPRETESVSLDLRGTGRLGALLGCALASSLAAELPGVEILVAADEDQVDMVYRCSFATLSSEVGGAVSVAEVLDTPCPISTLRKITGFNLRVSGPGINTNVAAKEKAMEILGSRRATLVTSISLADGPDDAVVSKETSPDVLVGLMMSCREVISDDEFTTCLAAMLRVPYRHAGVLSDRAKRLISEVES